MNYSLLQDGFSDYVDGHGDDMNDGDMNNSYVLNVCCVLFMCYQILVKFYGSQPCYSHFTDEKNDVHRCDVT